MFFLQVWVRANLSQQGNTRLDTTREALQREDMRYRLLGTVEQVMDDEIEVGVRCFDGFPPTESLGCFATGDA